MVLSHRLGGRVAASRKPPVGLGIVIVFVGLTASLCSPAAAAPTFAVDGTAAAPNPVAPGATTVISTGITATSESAFGIIVDLEVYSAGGVQVFQQVTSSDFSAGQRLGFHWTWALPAG